MLLLEALQLKAASLRRKKRSERTIEFYNSWIRSLNNFLMFKDLESITLQQLRLWIDSLIARGLATNSWRGAAMTAKIFFKWCTLEGMIDHNIADRLELPKAFKRIPDALETDQVLTILNDIDRNSLNHDRDVAIICFITQTGARLSEVATLTIDHLHIDDCYAIVIGKGNKQRFVFFGEAVQYTLRRWLVVRNSAAANVFGLKPSGIQELTKRLNRRSGIKCNPHKFRRTSATLRAENNAQANDLREMMGWESVEMAEHYIVQARLRKLARSTTPIDAELLKQTTA